MWREKRLQANLLQLLCQLLRQFYRDCTYIVHREVIVVGDLPEPVTILVDKGDVI